MDFSFVNIIKVDLELLASSIDKYINMLNVNPVIICNPNTLFSIVSFDTDNKTNLLKYETVESESGVSGAGKIITTYINSCKVLFDYTLSFGEIQIR
jgi:hypothetical protein